MLLDVGEDEACITEMHGQDKYSSDKTTGDDLLKVLDKDIS